MLCVVFLDLDECMLGMTLCSIQSSVCVNTAGGYYCQCRPGFSGEEHHCTGEHSLMNFDDLKFIFISFTFSQSFSCCFLSHLDIDECKMGTHKCDERAECINTIGKYRCKCQAGYSGNGHTCQGAVLHTVS